MIPADLLTPELSIALITAAIAGIMRGFSGFGTALVFAPVLTLLFGPKLGVPTVVLIEIPISLQLLPGAVRHAHWPETAALAIPACLLIPLGGYLLVVLDPVLVKRVIGVAVLAFACVLMSGWRYRGPRPLPLTLTIGAGSGVLKGVTGFSGPPVIVYLLAGTESARYHRATLIVYFSFVNVLTVLPFWYYDLLTAKALWLTALITPVVMVSVWVGTRLFASGGERLFRRIALAFLFGLAVLAILA